METLSWDDELAYRVVGGSYGVLRSVAEGVIGMGMLAKSFAGAGMYQTGLSAQLGLVDAHAADAEVVGRTVATMVDFVRHPIDTTVKYVNNSLAAADQLEANGDLLGASAERSSMVFNIGTAAVDGYGLVRAAAPVAGRVAGRLLSDLGDSMMGAGSLRSQIGAVGDVSTIRPFTDLNGSGPSSRLVEGGGLQAHEDAGGHLLLKHVGQSENSLVERMVREPHITGSSSFYDRATAEMVVSKSLEANQSKISSWLNGSSSRMRLDQNFPDSVGITVTSGATSAVEVNSARVVLVRDPSMPMGYRVQTGFPTIL
ncbi:RNase A-like domain-containing protein [Xanthomonas oryzae]|uniref:RNase A-like domain-containing protein n=1 Tax=Xanthomonas oryzae TaxID=347 RepID=UPI00103478D5|nr:RNase A-like domain-containing protein [Xanthomonas oryzae]QBH01549.1 hypothetical protein EYC56_22795 [Xanthomonas oryzae]